MSILTFFGLVIFSVVIICVKKEEAAERTFLSAVAVLLPRY
ncbi:MAG: hypothetical protein ABIE14_01045 [Patescibacteria group bacterium]